MHISRRLLFRAALFSGFIGTYLWLNSLTVIGSEVWDAHLQGLSPWLELPIYASPLLCLLIGILTLIGRLPLQYAAVALGLFVLLGFIILHLWYVPYNPDMKRQRQISNQQDRSKAYR